MSIVSLHSTTKFNLNINCKFRSNDECGPGCQPSEIECCPMNVVIEYPLSGVSAITSK